MDFVINFQQAPQLLSIVPRRHSESIGLTSMMLRKETSRILLHEYEMPDQL